MSGGWLAAVGVVGTLAAGRLSVSGSRRAAAWRRLAEPAARAAEPFVPPARLGAALERCALDVAPERATMIGVGLGGAAATIGLLLGGLVLAVGVVALGAAGLALGYGLMRHRRDDRIEAELPETLEATARALRAGLSLRQALTTVAADAGRWVRADLVAVAAVLAAGTSVADALGRWERRRPLPGVALTVAALTLAAEAGGAQARAVDGVATTLRDRHQLQREAQALASQAMTSGLVVALLPIGFLAVTVSADPESARFLVSTPLGLACLAGGLALDGTAAIWMHRIARRLA